MKDTNVNHHKHAVFTCPKCGVIERDDVMFLCNSCKTSEVSYNEDVGMYMCPQCTKPGQNFECMNCESKEVVMSIEENK